MLSDRIVEDVAVPRNQFKKKALHAFQLHTRAKEREGKRKREKRKKPIPLLISKKSVCAMAAKFALVLITFIALCLTGHFDF